MNSHQIRAIISVFLFFKKNIYVAVRDVCPSVRQFSVELIFFAIIFISRYMCGVATKRWTSDLVIHIDVNGLRPPLATRHYTLSCAVG